MATTNDFDDSTMDDLFEYDIDDRDLGELDITIPDLPPAPSQTKKGKDDLGLDKEVEVKQKRVVVKLDEQRSSSPVHYATGVYADGYADCCRAMVYQN